MDADVLIVGAGVSGCALALHLAGAGLHVVVIDRAGSPRDKVCGEGLMPHGVGELASLGVLSEVDGAGAHPFHGIAYHAGGATAVGRFPGRPGLGVARTRLDRVLVERAAEVADVRLGVRLTDLRIGRGVTAETSVGALSARVIVGADGLNSVVRRKLGLAGPRDDRPRYGVRQHLRLASGVADRALVDVHMADRCELYVTPTGPGEVNVAVLCERDVSRGFGGDLDGGFARLVASCPAVHERLGDPLDAPRLCGPLRQQVRGAVADRALLVGDAAGFVDGITGEGMSVALASSRLAAETLVARLADDRLSAGDLAPYDRARRRMARDLTRLTELVLWGIRRPRVARRVVRNLARHPDTFSRFLAVNTGARWYGAVGPRDLWRALVG